LGRGGEKPSNLRKETETARKGVNGKEREGKEV